MGEGDNRTAGGRRARAAAARGVGWRGRLLDTVLLSRRGAALGAAVLVILLGLNASVFLFNTQTLLSQQGWVTHTQTVLAALNGSMATITNAESAQRGYVLSGASSYLKTYAAAERQVMPDITTLRRLVSDNPTQVSRADGIRGLADTKLADLRQTIALRRTGQQAQAEAIVLDSRGEAVTAALQRLFDAMTQTELTLLRQRSVDAARAVTTTRVTLILATAADALLLAGALLAIQRSFTRRARLADERGRLLARAQQARAEAEAAVKARDEFLSLAAHELRTPLTALLGNTQLLQARREALGPRDQRLVTAIGRGTERLRALTEYLLDASRIEQTGPDLDLRPLDLAALARQAVAEIQDTVPGRTLRVVAPEEPVAVAADRVRLEQVVHNLLANAVKYSPDGSEILVTVDRASGGHARLAVGDQGIGIPSGALEHLFDRFYRAPNADPHMYSGLGLGLYVVREIVTGHGGAIVVESTEGAGSTFTIELPATQNTSAQAGPPSVA